eukprot:scaffold209073_cov21-Prasinocladus_malaysianus.AAC.2
MIETADIRRIQLVEVVAKVKGGPYNYTAYCGSRNKKAFDAFTLSPCRPPPPLLNRGAIHLTRQSIISAFVVLTQIYWSLHTYWRRRNYRISNSLIISSQSSSRPPSQTSLRLLNRQLLGLSQSIVQESSSALLASALLDELVSFLDN